MTPECEIPDCTAPRRNQTWCEKHYRRWYEHGDPNALLIEDRKAPLIERVWRRLEIGDCWQWTGAPTDRGYGRITYRNKKVYVHRAVWEHLVGPIPDDHELDHLCRNTLCANPDHLEPVTHAENMRRSHRWKGWVAAPLSAPKAGIPYSCKVCAEEFMPTRRDQMYCSSRCCEAAARERRLKATE